MLNQIRTAEEKLADVRAILQEWTDKQGHERCWFYPDIFRRLCTTLNVVPSTPPRLPSRSEFELGCKRYQEEEFEAVEIVMWPDGFWTDKEDFEYEKYAHKSDDYKILRLTQAEYEALLVGGFKDESNCC